MNHLRQTGRTTRMLEHAKALSEQGQKVCVVAATSHDILRFTFAVANCSGASILIGTPQSLHLDWSTLSIPGERCHILIDHHVIEDRFAAVLKMLHAYDTPLPLSAASA